MPAHIGCTYAWSGFPVLGGTGPLLVYQVLLVTPPRRTEASMPRGKVAT
jgi:hypothetical protein